MHARMEPSVIAEPAGWRRQRGRPPLAEVFGSISTRPTGSLGRKLMAFLGPGYLVAVGYMDPGNWATSLAGGSKFGYALLTVALLSNLMAILLQALCARLGIASGRDLAQACRDAFPRYISWPLWVLAEIAICATDLAEVIGTAIGLNLLFHIPLEIGVILTALDVFLVLWMQNLGFRYIEAFVVTLLGVIAACFAVQIAMADPDWGAVIRGFAPTTEIVTNPEMLYLALGIIGATVMPHNLYLHSGVVQTRRFGDDVEDRREAIKLATLDSTIALMFALLINASILILAAATFYKAGKHDIAELDQAHSFIAPLLGSALAPTLFGVALLCCGLNSTVTATLAGQIVMEGFLDIRLPGWARRLITRAIAIVPAAIVRRKRHRAASDSVAGHPEPAIAVRDCAAGDVHRRSQKNGRAGSAALGDGARRHHRGCHHCAEYQAAGRCRTGKRLKGATFPRGSSLPASAAPAAESGPCNPSSVNRRPNSRDRRKAGPCGWPARCGQES
jgi:manganese transport protein